jgi:hypothetical protein
MAQNNYTPNNWYWNIGQSSIQVFSSASLTFVPLTDATYLAWVAAGNRTTRIDTGINLFDVLSTQVLPSLFSNGVAFRSTSIPSLNATYPCDSVAQQTMTGIMTSLNAGIVPGNGTNFLYNSVIFTSAQFLAVAKALTNYVYDFNLQLSEYLNSNGSSGSFPSVPIQIA